MSYKGGRKSREVAKVGFSDQEAGGEVGVECSAFWYPFVCLGCGDVHYQVVFQVRVDGKLIIHDDVLEAKSLEDAAAACVEVVEMWSSQMSEQLGVKPKPVERGWSVPGFGSTLAGGRRHLN